MKKDFNRIDNNALKPEHLSAGPAEWQETAEGLICQAANAYNERADLQAYLLNITSGKPIWRPS
jgi:hypothetical protein